MSFGSNSNYILDNGCNPITGLAVTIQVTQDIVCQSASGSTTGFGFQLNAYSPRNWYSAWQQYVIAIFGSEIVGAVDNWPLSGPNIINHFFNLASTLNAKLSAGYTLKISLQNDNYGNITAATYVVIDEHGTTQANVTQALQPLSQLEFASDAPSLAVFSNSLFTSFVADNSSKTLLSCSTANGTSWNSYVTLSQSSSRATSLAVFNGHLYVAFIANNSGNAVLICSSADGTSWTNNTDINQSSSCAPSLAVFNGRLYVAFIANNSGNAVLVCSSADGTSWTNNTDINQSSSHAPSLAVFNGRLYVAFIANNSGNAVLVCSSADGTSWTNNTDINQSSSHAPSLAVFQNRLYVAFIANNSGNAVLVCSTADGTNWTNNSEINPDLAPIIAFELNLVGPVNSESAVLSSGAGTFEYTSSDALTPLSQEPSCAESGYVTAETANSVYGTLPSTASKTISQTFSVTTGQPMMKKAGKIRPGLIYP
jgi:hypothetical protein